MSVKKDAKYYKNTEYYKKVKQAEAELSQKIKETGALSLAEIIQRIKKASTPFLEPLKLLLELFLRSLAKLFLGLLPHRVLGLLVKLFLRLCSKWTLLGKWTIDHFDLEIKGEKGRASFVIQPKSFQGYFLVLLVELIIFILLFKIYPVVFSPLVAWLGIASWLGFPLLITIFCGRLINLPLFILTARLSQRRINFELFPLWLLKRSCLPSYKTRNISYSHIGINVSGGLIPIVLALYQFHRAQPLAILLVTAIVGMLSYFLVKVIPERAIGIRRSSFLSIATVAALLAMAVVAPGVNRTDVSVAFAGGVLGTTIGADLLHIKDVRPETAATPLAIGGAGLNDGIVQCGLYALIIAEWLPTAIAWLSTHSR